MSLSGCLIPETEIKLYTYIIYIYVNLQTTADRVFDWKILFSIKFDKASNKPRIVPVWQTAFKLLL